MLLSPEARVDLQTGRHGPVAGHQVCFFPSPVREDKCWGHRCDSLTLLVLPSVSLLVNSQDAESITWPDAILVTACVMGSGAE